jgi:hypothetical protein
MAVHLYEPFVASPVRMLEVLLFAIFLTTLEVDLVDTVHDTIQEL